MVPSLWRFEFKSVLVQYFRHDLISHYDLKRVMNDVSDVLNPTTYDADDDLVLDLACRSGCSSYDCEYVALAEILNIPFVTNDGKLISAFPETVISPEKYLR